MIWWTLTHFFLVRYGIGGSTGTYATSFFFGSEHIRNFSDSESTGCAESQLSFLRYTCFFPPCHLCSTCVIAQKENDQGAKLRGKENWKLNDFYCSKWKRKFSIRISCLLIILYYSELGRPMLHQPCCWDCWADHCHDSFQQPYSW